MVVILTPIVLMVVGILGLMFVHLRFSKSHNVVSIRLSLAYSFNIIYGILQSTCGWLTYRIPFHSEITEHCMDHHFLRIPFCDSGLSTSFQSWGEMHLITISKLIYIYIYFNPRLQVFQEKTPDVLIQKVPPEQCDKNHPVCWMARRARLLLSSNSQWF